MGYNKAREERILRQEGMSETKIMELHQYDWGLFNADRIFRQKQFTNSQLIDYVETVSIQLPIRDFDDILDQIEDMHLYYVMKNTNIQTMAILYLKIEGYTNKEISSILGLNGIIIRKRIFDVRKKLDK